MDSRLEDLLERVRAAATAPRGMMAARGALDALVELGNVRAVDEVARIIGFDDHPAP